MRSLVLAVAAALAGTVSAKRCMNITVPVEISSRNAVFNIAVPETNLDVTTFVQNLTRQGRNFSDVALAGYATVAGRYDISAKFCAPDNMTTQNPTVQVLTHGIGFDKTYWDLPYNNYNYSYVDTAINNYTYCTLTYDRLGIGNSSHGEPLNEIQSFLEIEALYAMTSMLRNGTFPHVNQTFDTIVHVGHSFGSAQTYAMVNKYPNASDGIVLTGFSMNPSFVGYFAAGGLFQLASTNQPFRFGNVNGSMIQTSLESLFGSATIGSPDYLAGLDLGSAIPKGQNLPNGYLLSANAQADQFLFLYPGNFDPQLAVFAEETKQPVTLGEILTLGSLPTMNQFSGPVLVFTAEHDLPYCGGDCLATGDPSLASIPAAVKMNFPNVPQANFTTLIQPNTGHGLTTHYNATAGYIAIQEFLGSKGLASS